MRCARQFAHFCIETILAAAFIMLALLLSPQGQEWAARIALPQDPTLVAIATDDVAGLRRALAGGCCEVRYPSGGTPLVLAAGGSDIRIVLELLASGADPNTSGNLGFTPLHAAVMSGDLEVAQLLLQYGASVDSATAGRITPVISAAQNGDDAMVRLLLAYGATRYCVGDCLATSNEERAHSQPAETLRFAGASADVLVRTTR